VGRRSAPLIAKSPTSQPSSLAKFKVEAGTPTLHQV